MSIKNLFGKSFKNYDSASVNVESPTFINNEVRERDTYIPPIDFSTASNFVRYGSAKLYYEDSIKRIYNNYPYDGSKAEIIEFHQSSSYLDRWMFDTKYPKSTGYIDHGQTANYGSIVDGYGTTNSPEFIRVFGGMSTASAGMENQPLRDTFSDSIRYNVTLNRTQNWRLNIPSGSTVEFWLKKDEFDTSNTHREVILDLWNGEDTSSSGYGRLTIEIIPSASVGCFVATLQSGAAGFFQQTICDSDITVSTLTSWHHYAMSFTAADNGITTRFYVDGAENLTQTIGVAGGAVGEIGGLINGYLGALQTPPMGLSAPAYAGKFSGSLDEFRYWKTRRKSSQIGYNWFRQVGGGANTDTATSDLGVYFKFNEGIVGNVEVDNTCLDYSGRLANGLWHGYTATARFTGSAFNSSSYDLVEKTNPIIYSTHPEVVSLSSEMDTSGSNHDNLSGSSMYHSLPTWLINEDEATSEKNLKKTMQILGSYFDTLHAQIDALPSLRNKDYIQSGDKPLPFANRLLDNHGFDTEEIFSNSSIGEMFSSADFNAIKFEDNLADIKNLIYTNIYNNLEKIYKSKGTEKSIRNLIRCFGVDDELIKLNVYTDGGLHYFTDKTKATSVRKKYINFDGTGSFSSTLYQTSSANNDLTFISGSTGFTDASNSAFTLEADIVVPYKKTLKEIGFYETPFTQSSVFGFHEARDWNPSDYTWATQTGYDEIANLQIYLVRDKKESKMAKFLIQNQDNTIYLTSSYIADIYDNNHWNIAIRVKPDTYPYAGNVTNTSPSYRLDVYGVNYNIDTIENEFFLTASLSNTSGSAYLNNPKRVYAGAHVQNFTGSVLEKSDVQVGAVRAWLDYVENTAIQAHNKDVTNYGVSEAYRDSNMFTIDNAQIPTQELTIFNWDFDTVTGSDGSGDFIIDDITSGSTNTIYGWIDGIIRREYKGLGSSFPTSQASFIDNEFIYAQKKELPEISYTNDNVFIKGERQINFIKDDDVSDNFYLLEKSMNQVVSEEMLKMFSSIQEFANLMGRPVDTYRQDYKRLDAVREHFFQRVEQDLDLEQFIQYYKWIDGAISKMITQLIPASVNFGDGVTDIIESHILERNKNARRVGLLDTVTSTEGTILGINDLRYSWKYGHAPQENWTYPNESYLKISPIGSAANRGFGTTAVGTLDTWTMYGWMKTAGAITKSYEVDLTGSAVMKVGITGPQSIMRIQLSDINSTVAFPLSNKTWDVTGLDLGEWTHFAFHLNASNATLDSHLTVYINGVSASCTISAGGSHTQDQTYYDVLNLLPDTTSSDEWSIDEFGVLTGSFDSSKALEIYNNGKYFDMGSYSDLANVVTHWRMGDVYPDKWSTAGSEIAGSIGAHVMQISASLGNQNFSVVSNSSNFNMGTPSISVDNNNCLWRKERQIRTDISDRESIREVAVNKTNASGSILAQSDGTIYEGSTYIPRALGRPYKTGISFANQIHGGINYPKQKNRDFVKEVTTVHGRKGASGAPVNVFGIGIGVTDGIEEKQICDDVYDPNKKNYYNATTQVGKFSGDSANAPLSAFEDYQYKLKASLFWPFNILSGTLDAGYNKRVYDLFRTSSIAVNLHSDTVDLTNEIPMQGPFTETWVGGSQNRHVNINKYDSALKTAGNTNPTLNYLQDQYTRPEAWRLLLGDNPASITPDGAMGFVGPDYGGPYPDQTRRWAIYYREERAKRPVNIKNISSSVGGARLGNYQFGYEVFSTFSNQKYYLRRHTGSLLPESIASELPKTTNYLSLVSQAPGQDGNYFGPGSNRLPDPIYWIVGPGAVSTGSFEVSGAYVAATPSMGSFTVSGGYYGGALASGQFTVTGAHVAGGYAAGRFTVTGTEDQGSYAVGQFTVTGAYIAAEKASGSFRFYGANTRGYQTSSNADLDYITFNSKNYKVDMDGSESNSDPNYFFQYDSNNAVFWSRLNALISTTVGQYNSSYTSVANTGSAIAFTSSVPTNPVLLETAVDSKWPKNFYSWIFNINWPGHGEFLNQDQFLLTTYGSSGSAQQCWIDTNGDFFYRVYFGGRYYQYETASFLRSNGEVWLENGGRIGGMKNILINHAYTTGAPHVDNLELWVNGYLLNTTMTTGGEGDFPTNQQNDKNPFDVHLWLFNSGNVVARNLYATASTVAYIETDGVPGLDGKDTYNAGYYKDCDNLKGYVGNLICQWDLNQYDTDIRVLPTPHFSASGGDQIKHLTGSIPADNAAIGLANSAVPDEPYAIFSLTASTAGDSFNGTFTTSGFPTYYSYYEAITTVLTGGIDQRGALDGNYITIDGMNFIFDDDGTADSAPNFYIQNTGTSGQMWATLRAKIIDNSVIGSISRSDSDVNHSVFSLTSGETGSAHNVTITTTTATSPASFTGLSGMAGGRNQEGAFQTSMITIENNNFIVAATGTSDSPPNYYVLNTGSSSEFWAALQTQIVRAGAVSSISRGDSGYNSSTFYLSSSVTGTAANINITAHEDGTFTALNGYSGGFNEGGAIDDSFITIDGMNFIFDDDGTADSAPNFYIQNTGSSSDIWATLRAKIIDNTVINSVSRTDSGVNSSAFVITSELTGTEFNVSLASDGVSFSSISGMAGGLNQSGSLPGHALTMSAGGTNLFFNIVRTPTADSSPNFYIVNTGSDVEFWNTLKAQIINNTDIDGITLSQVGVEVTPKIGHFGMTSSVPYVDYSLATSGDTFGTLRDVQGGTSAYGATSGSYLDFTIANERFIITDSATADTAGTHYIVNTGSNTDMWNTLKSKVEQHTDYTAAWSAGGSGATTYAWFALTSSATGSAGYETLAESGEAYANLLSPSGGTEAGRSSIDNVIEIPRMDLTKSSHTISSRFSAPGGPEINSPGYLNITTQEYSVYNSLNFRNLSVDSSGSGEIGRTRVNSNLNRREGNRTLLARHCGKGGVDSQWGSITYVDSGSTDPQPAFYKQHRNTLVSPKIVATHKKLTFNNFNGNAGRPGADVRQGLYIDPPNDSKSLGSIDSGPLSFSFWIKIDEGTILSGTKQIFNTDYKGYTWAAFEITYKLGSSDGKIEFQCSGPWTIEDPISVQTYSWSSLNNLVVGKWCHLVFSWNGDRSSVSEGPKLYVNGNLWTDGQSRSDTGTVNPLYSLDRSPWNQLSLMDALTWSGTTARGLSGSLSDFAIYTGHLTADQAGRIYLDNGNPLKSAPARATLWDYWKLGTEATITGSEGEYIPAGLSVGSEIGKWALTTYDSLTASAGPYNTFTAADTETYNNMNYSSLLPRSDFQYKWVLDAISGSDWMKDQRVRGYAPKGGEIVVYGNGAIQKFYSAITFPSASQIYGE